MPLFNPSSTPKVSLVGTAISRSNIGHSSPLRHTPWTITRIKPIYRWQTLCCTETYGIAPSPWNARLQMLKSGGSQILFIFWGECKPVQQEHGNTDMASHRADNFLCSHQYHYRTTPQRGHTGRCYLKFMHFYAFSSISATLLYKTHWSALPILHSHLHTRSALTSG